MPFKDPEAKREYHRAYMKKWYAQNKKKHIEFVRASRDKRRKELQWQVAELKSIPCADCGGMFPPEAMDFDHLSDDKLGNVAAMVNDGRRRATLEEVKKCEVVCANCHRVRTKKRRGVEQLAVR